jgi:alginate O-acetyltransferase complex protein AlgJ
MSEATPTGPDAPLSPDDPQRGDELNVATDAHLDLERAILPGKVSAGLARVLIVAFCSCLAIVPIVQIALEATGRQRAQLADLVQREPTRANLHRYEEDVARNSVFKQAVQPEVQLVLSTTTGYGNSKVYIGRDGVLFYRPGMNFVTGRGILDSGRIRALRKRLIDAGEQNAEPDPRPAILAFHAACRSAGVRLVVVPAPDKIMLMPEKAGLTLKRGDSASASVTNSDYSRFVAELREAGVDVFDPMTAGPWPADKVRYLDQDTHWTPEWMEVVAKELAEHVRSTGALAGGQSVSYVDEPVNVTRVGDLVDMLDLPKNQTLFPPKEVTVRKTLNTKTGQAWSSEASADVVLLGDSFANIYTAPQMGWGESAGLAPRLSRHLGRPIDAITLNGGGASNTRRELARRQEGLSGKRVIIWEFTVRELTDASWDVIPFGSAATPPALKSSGSTLEVEGTLEKVSKVPEPFSSAYPDCVTFTLLKVDRVIEGKYDDSHMLLVMWAMKNNVWLKAAKYAPGQRLRVKVMPLKQADNSVRSAQRADNTEVYDRAPYFAIEEQAL